MVNQLTYNEHKVAVNTFDIMQQEHSHWSSGKFFEVENLKLLEFNKREGMFIDIGARTGNYSLFVKKVTGRECIAFEPDVILYEWLRKNIFHNEFQIQILNIALSDYSGYAYRPNGKTVYIKSRNELLNTKVNILDVYKLPKVGIMRINCTSHHRQILSGARQTIKKYEPDLFFNIYNRKTEILEQIKMFLNNTLGLKYEYQISSTDTLHHFKMIK